MGAATESTYRAWRSMAPFLAMLRSGQVLGKAHLNKEYCLTELSQTMLHLSTQESPMAGPVHLWLVSLGLLALVAMGTWCPSIRQSPAEASAGHGVLPALLVHLEPCPSCSKECRAEWGCGCLLTAQYCSSSSWQGGIGQTPVGKEVPGSSGAGQETWGRKSWVGWG